MTHPLPPRPFEVAASIAAFVDDGRVATEPTGPQLLLMMAAPFCHA